jgi:ribosomal protein L20A (L18A)
MATQLEIRKGRTEVDDIVLNFGAMTDPDHYAVATFDQSNKEKVRQKVYSALRRYNKLTGLEIKISIRAVIDPETGEDYFVIRRV